MSQEETASEEKGGAAVPKAHLYARIGGVLKRFSGFTMLGFTVLHLAILVVVHGSIPKGYDGPIDLAAVVAFYSWLYFAISMIVSLVVFWIGDCLKRKYQRPL